MLHEEKSIKNYFYYKKKQAIEKMEHLQWIAKEDDCLPIFNIAQLAL